jgi:Gluconate 2-dehydrogenase subunit 3
MNRRKAIGRIILAGIGGTLAFGGYKWYEGNKTPDLAWLGQQNDLLAALADTIIPGTGSPGARAAGVQDFMIILLRDCTDRRSLNNFIDGLHDLQSHCRSKYQAPFTHCSEADRISTLTYFEKRDRPHSGIWGKAENRYLGKPFFMTLKEYTVTAYCTSELGATHGLAYVPVPVTYHGCIPLQPGQPAWATK